jgi:hypothetical protein
MKAVKKRIKRPKKAARFDGHSIEEFERWHAIPYTKADSKSLR